MNELIFKYALDPSTGPYSDRVILNLPRSAEILSIAEQRGNIVLYAFIELDNHNEGKTEPYTFIIKGTGQYAGNFKRENYTFLGTVNLLDGALMFHVFYRKGD